MKKNNIKNGITSGNKKQIYLIKLNLFIFLYHIQFYSLNIKNFINFFTIVCDFWGY